MQSSNQKQVRVARIGKPHGIRGEVTVELFTDSPEVRFVRDNTFAVRISDAPSEVCPTLTVEKARWNKNIMLLKFAEFSDRNTAESLRNSELYAEPEESTVDEDSWYADDLIGLAVHQEVIDSPVLGEVSNLITGEAQDLIEIRLLNGNDVLLPFVEEIVPEIDEERGAIVITPPPGLLELNQD
ncbi:ribosome maturation factor RimM [Yaniella flava]|uniref:Ribosome maturation factor RimM n=1 Tax=Yaniella flava TaxID=287930 RepID=A0ABP5G4R3_9MICC